MTPLSPVNPANPVNPSVPEHDFACHGRKTGLQLALGLAASAGLVISVGVLPASAWLQVATVIVCGLVITITISNVLLQRRIKPSTPFLIIRANGIAVTRNDLVCPATETLLSLRFAWRGQQSARLVFVAPDGAEHHWRLYRRDLNASQWRYLCRWILWLERGQKPV